MGNPLLLLTGCMKLLKNASHPVAVEKAVAKFLSIEF